ncbi:MAG: TIGR03960 family B12-binding radical SAM protein, partial [Elusimicrobiota bacterium]|nr:TIGR03960 family B12-binding radical SAM protein [Elusimicrobiota bacterium]
MKNKDLDEILNLVRKPARYINCELNSHPADMQNDFSIVLCFADLYEIGASNLGLEILYHLINEKKLARCERAFCPDDDMGNILRQRGISLFSLESNSPLKSFDIVGFTIQSELCATNILNILDLSNIELFAKNRADGDPLIIAGGPALTNPQPLCDFFDLFVLGDGEEAIEDIICVCRKFKNKISRQALLKELSKIEGVYVPMFYQEQYNADGTLKSITADNQIKPIVKKRLLNLSNAYFPAKKIVPFIETVHNRLNIEVARGCPGRCRFCQASKYYRPWRQRPVEQLLELVRNGIAFSGYEQISFSSLSCSDYKDLDKLLIETNNLYADSKISISLPSLRCTKRSVEIAKYINKDKRPTLTFAPEAGSDRLRNVIGKYLSQDDIAQTLLSAYSMGWEVVKLYFMIGLPTETLDDLADIKNMLAIIKSQAKKMQFTITASPFVPKAQTPFQWAPMESDEKINEKIKYLNTIKNANVRAHN